jgi:hypothetical protein
MLLRRYLNYLLRTQATTDLPNSISCDGELILMQNYQSIALALISVK